MFDSIFLELIWNLPLSMKIYIFPSILWSEFRPYLVYEAVLVVHQSIVLRQTLIDYGWQEWMECPKSDDDPTPHNQ